MKTTLTALVLALALVSCEKEPIESVTVTVTNITTTQATVTGESTGYGEPIEQGFEFRAADWPLGKTAPVDATFSRELTMLAPGTTYFVRAFIQVQCMRVYSGEGEFNTLER